MGPVVFVGGPNMDPPLFRLPRILTNAKFRRGMTCRELHRRRPALGRQARTPLCGWAGRSDFAEGTLAERSKIATGPGTGLWVGALSSHPTEPFVSWHDQFPNALPNLGWPTPLRQSG